MKTIRENHVMHNDFLKGTIGFTASIGAIVFSTISTLIPWLQALSLIVGIGVGLMTFYSIRKEDKRRDKRENEDRWK